MKSKVSEINKQNGLEDLEDDESDEDMGEYHFVEEECLREIPTNHQDGAVGEMHVENLKIVVHSSAER